jgi:nucleoside-diphosphate-sugar epimerase
LVGSQIAAQLIEKGERPVILDARPQSEFIKQIVDLKNAEMITGDVLDFEALETLVAKGVDRIVHTAANPMLTVGAQKRPHDAIKVNIMGTANVLEVARRRNVKRVVFTSSSVLYTYRRGGLESGLAAEDNFPRTTTIYASTKLAGENLGLNYVNDYGLDFVAVRFAAVFGPWMGEGGGGPSSMFKQVMEKSIKGEPATISPRTLEFVYSKDAAKGAVLALEAKSVKERVYNIGMGRVYTPQQIVSMVKEKTPSAKITVENLPIGSPAVTLAEPMSLKRSKEEIGYSPGYDMPRAIEDYISFYKKHG